MWYFKKNYSNEYLKYIYWFSLPLLNHLCANKDIIEWNCVWASGYLVDTNYCMHISNINHKSFISFIDMSVKFLLFLDLNYNNTIWHKFHNLIKNLIPKNHAFCLPLLLWKIIDSLGFEPIVVGNFYHRKTVHKCLQNIIFEINCILIVKISYYEPVYLW